MTWPARSVLRSASTRINGREWPEDVHGVGMWEDFSLPFFNAWPGGLYPLGTANASSKCVAAVSSGGPGNGSMWRALPCDFAQPFTCKVFLDGEC